MKNILSSGLICILRKILSVVVFAVTLAYFSCSKPDDPVPVVKYFEQAVALQNDVELSYRTNLNNINSAVLTISRDGILILTETINDVTVNGPDFQKVYKFSDDPKIKKGKYEFILTSDKLVQKSLIEIPNYKPSANLISLNLKGLNFMEVFGTTISIPNEIFKDKNPEDTLVSATNVRSTDGKTTPTLKTTATGNDLNVKAVSGSLGAYQIELEFGSTEGGLEKSVLSGEIGKDNRIVINPMVYNDNPNAVYNSKTTRLEKDNYMLEQLLLRPKIPYSDKYYNCFHFEYQLLVDAIVEGPVRTSSGLGKYWLYNNYRGNNLDSIYANGGTLERMGTIEVPILMVRINDTIHNSPALYHGMNAILTGRDMSTGNLLTNFANYDFIEPQGPAINVQIGTYILNKDLDEIIITYPYVVEDKVNGNYLKFVPLVKFRIDNGVPTLTYENNDPKYNIIKQ